MQSAVKFALLSVSLAPSPLLFRFLFAIRAQSKPDPLRTPRRWWQFSLMSARLIGPSFINARSIEIGCEREDIGKVRARKTDTIFECSLNTMAVPSAWLPPRGEILSYRKHRSCRDLRLRPLQRLSIYKSLRAIATLAYFCYFYPEKELAF